jgi:hypothetical protein
MTVQSRAQAAVAKAKRQGLLIPQPCEVCGTTEKIHAHHDNYSKPLDVRWLCQLHHMQHHRSIRRGFRLGPKLDQNVKLKITLGTLDLYDDLKLLAERHGRTLVAEMRYALGWHVGRGPEDGPALLKRAYVEAKKNGAAA